MTAQVCGPRLAWLSAAVGAQIVSLAAGAAPPVPRWPPSSPATKRFAQVQRLQRLIAGIPVDGELDWARAAAECGYFDQAHRRMIMSVPATATLSSAGWASQGACQDEDPDLFFPIARAGPALGQIAQAKAVCARCRVRTECLSYALGTGQDSGIWGGTTGEERRALRGHKVEHRSTRTRDPGGESPNRSR